MALSILFQVMKLKSRLVILRRKLSQGLEFRSFIAQYFRGLGEVSRNGKIVLNS
jgi:hypothetical protein